MIRFKEQTELQEYDIDGFTNMVTFNQGDTLDTEVLSNENDPEHSDLLVEGGRTFMEVPKDVFEEI